MPRELSAFKKLGSTTGNCLNTGTAEQKSIRVEDQCCALGLKARAS